MKYRILFPIAAISTLMFSCAPQSSSEDYDVANPYAAPDYADSNVAANPPADVNPAYDSGAAYEDTAPPVSAPDAPVAPERPAAARVHTVVKGDSLWVISKKYNVPIDAIKAANAMTKDTVVLGTKLQIPAN